MIRILAFLAALLIPGLAAAEDYIARPISAYTLAISTTSTRAAVKVGPSISIMRLVSSVTAMVGFGVTPMAVVNGSTSMYLPAATPTYVRVQPGEKVAVVSQASGVLYITEMAK
jgi:hypothetical protein